MCALDCVGIPTPKGDYLRAMDATREAIGQAILSAQLAQRADDDALAHALLLTGAPGRGGLALALSLARRLHCKGLDTRPCGVCPSCLQHDLLQHPDLHFTFPVAKPPGKDKALSADQLDTWRKAILELGAHFDMSDLRDRMSLGNKQPFISVHEAADILRRLSLTSHAGGWKSASDLGSTYHANGYGKQVVEAVGGAAQADVVRSSRRQHRILARHHFV